MTKSTSLFITKNIANPAVSVVNADGANAKVVYTASSDDAVLKSLILTSDDTVTVNVQILISDGTTDRPIGTVALVAGSGTNGTVASVDALSSLTIPGLPTDQSGKRVLPMKAGQVLKIKTLTSVSAAKAVHAVGVAEEY